MDRQGIVSIVRISQARAKTALALCSLLRRVYRTSSGAVACGPTGLLFAEVGGCCACRSGGASIMAFDARPGGEGGRREVVESGAGCAPAPRVTRLLTVTSRLITVSHTVEYGFT
jgi:hypothetical protein